MESNWAKIAKKCNFEKQHRRTVLLYWYWLKSTFFKTFFQMMKSGVSKNVDFGLCAQNFFCNIIVIFWPTVYEITIVFVDATTLS